MLGKLRAFFTDAAGIMFPFGGNTGRIFPGYVLVTWRDGQGFSPRIQWAIHQEGPRDQSLMPWGFRSLYGALGRKYRNA